MTSNYKGSLLFAFLFCLNFICVGQNINQLLTQNGGVEVIINESPRSLHHLLSHQGIILDHGSTSESTHLYITKEGYDYLVSTEQDFSLIQDEKASVKMKNYDEVHHLKGPENCLPVFDFYPTYEAYEQMMFEFEANYPEICRIINIGTLNSGRKLLVAQIGDNVHDTEDEPSFLYTSTMHGDELAGYPTMLKLIDHLLCNYDSDEQITDLVNNITIFINPLANPDGAYTNDNSTVAGARRFNALFVDLNRNFPDPKAGEHPDGLPYQEETLAFMQFSEDYHINLSCNIHGGAEVANYPWDTFLDRHADNSWWIDVCRDYADTVHYYAPVGYFNDSNNGITNGYDWYVVEGGRQDFITYFKRGREFTLELSQRKFLDSDDLPGIWDYNKSALLNYINEARFGLRGNIVDCKTGLPIEAEVYIEGHDKDNSSIYSSIESGNFFRYLKEGIYQISFIADGYDTTTSSAVIIDKSSTIVNIELCPSIMSNTVLSIADSFRFVQDGHYIRIVGGTAEDVIGYSIYSMNGQRVSIGSVIDRSIDISGVQQFGLYYLQIQSKHEIGGTKILIH